MCKGAELNIKSPEFLLFVGIALGAMSPATATIVSPAEPSNPVFSGQATANAYPFVAFGNFDGPNVDMTSSSGNGFADAHIAVDLSDPSLRVYGSASTPLSTSQAVAGLTYQVDIFGPANTTVPVTITANGLAQSVGGALLGDSLSISGPGLTTISKSLSVDGKSWYLSQKDSFQTNVIYTIVMEVQGVAEPSFGSQSYDVSIDPHFAIGPGYDQYSLVFSPTILNVSPVPEPSTWAMMIVGFLGLSWMACRRKSRFALNAG
jgi:hypothetical protein